MKHTLLLVALMLLSGEFAFTEESISRMPETWRPADSVPMFQYDGKGFRIIRYQYRIEFFKGDAKKPHKTLTFKHPITSYPDPMMWGKDSSGDILACTNKTGEYSLQDEEEKRQLGPAIGRIIWADPNAAYKEFCGIFGPSGKEVYRFPPEVETNEIHSPLGIFGNGKRAALLVGKYGPVSNPEEDAVGNMGVTWNEVWIWEPARKLRKHILTPDLLKGNVMVERLREGKL